MPILGRSTRGAFDFPVSGDRARVTKFVLPEAGDFTQVAMWFAAFETTAGTNAKFIIYADSGGEPGAFVFASGPAAIPEGGGLVTWTQAFSLAAGTDWLGYVADNFTARENYAEDVVGGQTRMMNNIFDYNSPPAFWNTADDNEYPEVELSAYGTYTAASTGNVGTLLVTNAAAIVSSAGKSTNVATASLASANASVSSSGKSTNLGNAAVTSANATLIATGGSSNVGSVAVLAADTVLVATGKSTNVAGVNVVSADALMSGSGLSTNIGTVNVLAGDATLVATGNSDDSNHGVLNVVGDNALVNDRVGFHHYIVP